MANLRIPNKTTSDKFNLEDFQNDFNIINEELSNKADKSYVDKAIEEVDVTEQLVDYAKKDEITPAVETYVQANRDTLKGDKGEKGEKGDQGIQGEKGADGAKGEKGEKGDQGIQGIQGEKGDKGDQGEPGKDGAKGADGAKGEKGDKGDKGDQGIQGVQGEKGDKGDKGDTGATGKDGLTTSIKVNGSTYTHSNGTITLPNYTLDVNTVKAKDTSISSVSTDMDVLTRINVLENETTELESLTLGIHTDGLIYLFKNGNPTGLGVKAGSQEDGNIIGKVDSNNNIVLTGGLEDGIYTIVYQTSSGEQISIGGLSLGQVVELFVPSTCVLNMRLNSSGVETSQNGTFVTDFIDIGDLAPSASRVILFSGFQIQMNRASSPYTKIDVYDSSKTRIGLVESQQSSSTIEYDETGVKTFKATVINPSTTKSARYIRVTGHLGEEYATQGTNAITSTSQLNDCSIILA